jgi:hypothetical protein
VPEWLRGVVRLELLSPDSIQVGARLREVRRWGGRELEAEILVTAHEPPRRYAGRVESHGVTATYRYDLRDEDTRHGPGTRVDLVAEVSVRGVLRPLRRLVVALLAFEDGGQLDDLARYVGRPALPMREQTAERGGRA